LKTVPDEVILKRVLRTGDGSHPYAKVQKVLEERKKAGGLNALGELRDTEHFWGFVSDLEII
jgi:hypothetical protein